MQETSYSPFLFGWVVDVMTQPHLVREDFTLVMTQFPLLVPTTCSHSSHVLQTTVGISLVFSFLWFFRGAYVLSLLVNLLISTTFASALTLGVQTL